MDNRREGLCERRGAGIPLCHSHYRVIPAKARLQGCTPAWMQVVERRLEQAAEVVPIPLLWRGARQGGVVERRLPAAGRSGTSGRGGKGREVKGWQVWPNARIQLSHLLSFPLRGNGLLNHWISACAGMTVGGRGQAFVRHGKGAVGMATRLFPPRRHSGAGRNPVV